MHAMHLFCWESTVQSHGGIIVSKCSLQYHGFEDSAIATLMHQLTADLAPAKDTGKTLKFVTFNYVGLAVYNDCCQLSVCKSVPKTRNCARAGVKCTLYRAYDGKSE